MQKVILSAIIVGVLCTLTACAGLPAYDEAYLVSTPETQPVTDPTAVPAGNEPEKTEAADTVPALLSSPEDICLHDTDGEGCSYVFTYGDAEFQAVYRPDNWRIIDSYQIRNTADIILICEALCAEHPIHSADYESFRTAEDMAYEWVQHNIAYTLLPEDSGWKAHAKDVDINPDDQGKSLLDLYRDRVSSGQ